MRVLLFGATGMVGQGVLRECLLDDDVDSIVTVGRQPSGAKSAKVRELVRENLFDLSGLESELRDFDACFFCIGVSSARLTEAEYRHVTFDLAVGVATFLAALNSRMTFVYVSGAGADSTEEGRTMWARVRGRTENAILRLPFKAALIFRPALIQPLHGIRSRTASYRIFYALAAPILPLLRRCLPKYVTTTEQIGRAMLRVAKEGAPKPILESADINRL